MRAGCGIAHAAAMGRPSLGPQPLTPPATTTAARTNTRGDGPNVCLAVPKRSSDQRCKAASSIDAIISRASAPTELVVEAPVLLRHPRPQQDATASGHPEGWPPPVPREPSLYVVN